MVGVRFYLRHDVKQYNNRNDQHTIALLLVLATLLT